MLNEISDNWYEDFFQGINCELWEKAIPPDVTKQEVDFLLSELNLQKGQQILDIPCGFGRPAIELSKKGFNVTGIDISKTFIKGLTEKIISEKLNIKAIQANIVAGSNNQICLLHTHIHNQHPDNLLVKIYIKLVVMAADEYYAGIDHLNTRPRSSSSYEHPNPHRWFVA